MTFLISTPWRDLLCMVSLGLAGAASAAVSPEEAAQLKTVLTPLGGLRAGNSDGSIPAWKGGLTTLPAGYTAGGKRPDPFKDEKPLFSITARNMAQYADKLADGTKFLLQRYPDSYRIDVYPTHRTAAAPQWVYDQIFRNATQATLIQGPAGPMPKGAFGGIPFPIPKTGAEVLWNHQLDWRGEAMRGTGKSYQLTGSGSWINVLQSTTEVTMPYYYKDEAAAFAADGVYSRIRQINAGPPLRAGQGLVGSLNLDESKSMTWVYLPGQRRTRKTPNACCDTPTPFSGGLVNFDEVGTFSGRMDRFDWKLIGKQELYIPYNNNSTESAPSDASVLGQHHLNPDHVRWELHRVWVVEATLRPGERHSSPKGRYYFDEDTSVGVLADRWDSKGQLARHVFTMISVLPDVPAASPSVWGVYDLLTGEAYVHGMVADERKDLEVMPRPGAAYFSPEAMAAGAVR